MRIHLIAVAVAVVLLAGCSHSMHSVAWYEHHPRTMDAVNTKCGDERGQGINDQNCLNAQQAVVNHLMQGVGTAPPPPSRRASADYAPWGGHSTHGSTPPKPFNPYARNPCPNRSC